MVGIVLVTHSAALAQGIKELAGQMAGGSVPIGLAGGIDDEDHPFGTDATRISAAIESVCSDDGALVLMDMGSSLLSAGLALEFLPEEKRNKVLLCEAPLVEGTIAAAVRSKGGGTLAEVAREARNSLSIKQTQLAGTSVESPGPGHGDTDEFRQGAKQKTQGAVREAAAYPPAGGGGRSIILTVPNRLGFHARPASKFVLTASGFRANITVQNITRKTEPVDARSINALMTLGVRGSHEICISANGPDADAALTALKSLVEAGFGEERTPSGQVATKKPGYRQKKEGDGSREAAALKEKKERDKTAPAGIQKGVQIRGIPASPGIAIGPAMRYQPVFKLVVKRMPEDPQTEWARLQAALQIVRKQIARSQRRMAAEAGKYEASIFDAHILTLRDPTLLEPAKRTIFSTSCTAEEAWKSVVDSLLASYRADDSSYIRARESDLEGISIQVLRILSKAGRPHLGLPHPCIVLAARIVPSDIAGLDRKKVLGICTAYGATNSHTMILLRSLDIPTLTAAGIEIMSIPDETPLVLNAGTGMLIVNPKQTKRYIQAQKNWQVSIALEKKEAGNAAVSTDGKKVPVLANIGSIDEAIPAREKGADGIGVLRTEFLFLQREYPPTEDEQVEAYTAIADAFDKLPVTVRTLDAGGDKPLHFLSAQAGDNPALGKRGIRLILDHPDILKTQFRAILKASAGYSMKIMLPMVTSVYEMRTAKNIFARAKEGLKVEGRRFDPSASLGIMIEVPAAALISASLARESDFFSIGTNDLCQYTLAADRTSPDVSPLNDALHPALLYMIKCTVSAGQKAGISVSVCGEIAADPDAVAVLLGLGIDTLSMNPSSIPRIKSEIRKIAAVDAKHLAKTALRCSSAEEVREVIRRVKKI